MSKRLCWTHGSLPCSTGTDEAACYVCALERLLARAHRVIRGHEDAGWKMLFGDEIESLLGKRALAKWRRRIEKEQTQGGNRDGE